MPQVDTDRVHRKPIVAAWRDARPRKDDSGTKYQPAQSSANPVSCQGLRQLNHCRDGRLGDGFNNAMFRNNALN